MEFLVSHIILSLHCNETKLFSIEINEGTNECGYYLQTRVRRERGLLLAVRALVIAGGDTRRAARPGSLTRPAVVRSRARARRGDGR